MKRAQSQYIIKNSFFICQSAEYKPIIPFIVTTECDIMIQMPEGIAGGNP
jgi:hypothetical protein